MAPPTLFLEGDPQGVLRIDWVSGAAMLLRAEAVGEKIFDETYFMFGEDMELCDGFAAMGGTCSTRASIRSSIITAAVSTSRSRWQSWPMRMTVRGAYSAMGAGRLSVFVYDAILLTGYLARWLVFGAAAAIRPGNGYEAKSRFSRNYVAAMLHVARE